VVRQLEGALGRLAAASSLGVITLPITTPPRPRSFANGAECERVIEVGHEVWDMAVLPNGNVAVCGNDVAVRVWDVDSGACARTIRGWQRFIHRIKTEGNDVREAAAPSDMQGDVDESIGIRRSNCKLSMPSADVRASAELIIRDCDVYLYESKPGAYLHSPHECTNNKLDQVRDSVGDAFVMAKLTDVSVAVGGANGSVCVYDFYLRRVTDAFDCGRSPIWQLCSFAQGKLLAAGAKNGGIHFMSVRAAEVTASIQLHTDRITKMMPLPDGRLVSGSLDGTLRVWAPS
jgi:WD40 repeat protein